MILIHHNHDFRKLLSINLNVYLGTEVIIANSFDDIKNIVSENDGQIEVILSPRIFDNVDISFKILNFLELGDLEIKTIIISNPLHEHDSAISHSNWKEIIKKAASYLEVTAESMNKENDNLDDFYPIMVSNLTNVRVEICSTDVFHRGDDNELDVIIEAGEEFPVELVDQLKISGEKYLYVKKSERLKFVGQITDQILHRLRDLNLDQEELIKTSETAYETVKDLLELTGLDETTIELAEASIASMESIVSKDNSLNELLQQLRENCSGYLYQHSVMIAGISHAIISNMDWGNKEQLHKICFISFFHDITLKEEHSKLHSEKEVQQLKTTQAEKKRILGHANEAAELLKNYPKTPFSADAVIRQHHGALNGIGFTIGLNQSLSPLAIVFIIAESYADMLLYLEPEFVNKENIFNQLSKTFNKGMYAQVLEVLKKIAA